MADTARSRALQSKPARSGHGGKARTNPATKNQQSASPKASPYASSTTTVLPRIDRRSADAPPPRQAGSSPATPVSPQERDISTILIPPRRPSSKASNVLEMENSPTYHGDDTDGPSAKSAWCTPRAPTPTDIERSHLDAFFATSPPETDTPSSLSDALATPTRLKSVQEALQLNEELYSIDFEGLSAENEKFFEISGSALQHLDGIQSELPSLGESFQYTKNSLSDLSGGIAMLHQEHEAEKQRILDELAATVDSNADEMVALAEAHATEKAQITELHMKQMHDTCTDFEQQIAALETKLFESEASYKNELEQLRRVSEAQLKQLTADKQEELDTAKKSAQVKLQSTEKAYKEQLEHKEREASEQMEQLRLSSAAKYEELHRSSSSAYELLRSSSTREYLELKEKSETEIADLKRSAAQELSNVRYKLNSEIETLKHNSVAEISALSEKSSQELQELRRKKEYEIEELRKSLSADIARISNEAAEERLRLHKAREEQVRQIEERRAQETFALRDELEIARSDHIKEIAELHTQYKSRIANMEDTFAAEQAAVTAAYTAQINELVRKSANELSDSIAHYEDRLRILSDTHSAELQRTVQQATLERESLVAKYKSEASKAEEERRQEREALVLKYETALELLRKTTREQLEQSTSAHEIFVTQLRDSCAGKVLVLENTLREQDTRYNEQLTIISDELETSRLRVRDLEESQLALHNEYALFVEHSSEKITSKEMTIAHQESIVLRLDEELQKARSLLEETQRKLRFTEDDRQVKAGTILELTFVIKSRDEEIEKLRQSLLDSIKTVNTKTEILEITTETLSTKAKELEDTRAALRLESGRLSMVEESMHQKEGILEDTTMKIESMRLNMENLRLEMKRMQMDMKLQLEHSESEMELKNGEIRRLHGAVGELKLKNDFNQQTIERLEDALGLAHRQADEAQRRINLFKLEAGNSAEEIKNISDQLNEKESELIISSKDKQALLSERNRLLVQLSTVNQFVQSLREQLECSAMLGDEAQTRYRRALERTITEKDEQMRAEKHLLTLELTASHDALKYLEGVEERLKESIQEGESLKTERSSLLIEITALQDNITRLEEDLKLCQGKSRDQARAYHDLKDAMESSETRLNGQLDAERRRVSELQAHVEETVEKLQEALNSAQNLGREKKQLQDDLERAARDHEFLVANANMEKAETLENISRLQSEMSERDAELRHIRENRLALQELVETTQSKLDRVSNELQRVREQLASSIDECSSLKIIVHELEEVRDHLEAQQSQESKDFMATKAKLEGEIEVQVVYARGQDMLLKQSRELALLALEDYRALICHITDKANAVESDLNSQLYQIKQQMDEALRSAEESKLTCLKRVDQEKAEAIERLVEDNKEAIQTLLEEKNSIILALEISKAECIQRLQNEKEEIMRLADEERFMLLRVAEEDKLAILRQAEEEKTELILERQIRESASRTHRNQERDRLRRLAKYEQERLTELNESAQMLSEEQQTRLLAEINRTKDENAALQIEHCLSEAATTLQLVQEQEQLRKIAHDERVRLLELNETTRMVAEEQRIRLLDKETERQRLFDEEQTAKLLEQHAQQQMAKEEECTRLLEKHQKTQEEIFEQQQQFREQHERLFMWNEEYETRLFVAHIAGVEALQDGHLAEKSKLADELAEVKRALDVQVAKADADKRDWEVSHASTLSSAAEKHQYELIESAKSAQEESARLKEKLEAEMNALFNGFEQKAEVIRLRTSEEYLLKINDMLQKSREEEQRHSAVVEGLQRELGAARAELAATSKLLELQTKSMGDTEKQLIDKIVALNAELKDTQLEMQRQLDAKQRQMDVEFAAMEHEKGDQLAAMQREMDETLAAKKREIDGKILVNQLEFDDKIAAKELEFDKKLATIQREVDERLATSQCEADESLATIRRQADERLAVSQREVEERFASVQHEADERLAAVQHEADERLAAVQRESDERLAAVQREADERLAAVQREADERLVAHQREADERLSAHQREAEEKISENQCKADERLAANQRDGREQLAAMQFEMRQQIETKHAEMEANKAQMVQVICTKELEIEELRTKQLETGQKLSFVQAELIATHEAVADRTATIESLRKELAVLLETSEGTRSAEQLLSYIRQQIEAYVTDSYGVSSSKVQGTSLDCEDDVLACIKSYFDMRCVLNPEVLEVDEVRSRLREFSQVSALLRGLTTESSNVSGDAAVAVEELRKDLNVLRTSTQALVFGESEKDSDFTSQEIASLLESFQGFFYNLRLQCASALDREARQNQILEIVAQHEQLLQSVSTSSERDHVHSVNDVCLLFDAIEAILARTREITGCAEFRCLDDMNKLLDECIANRKNVNDFDVEKGVFTAEMGSSTNFIGSTDVAMLLNEFEAFVGNCKLALDLDQHGSKAGVITAIDELMTVLHHFEALQPELGSPRRRDEDILDSQNCSMAEKPTLQSKVAAIVAFVNELKAMSEFAQVILDEECDAITGAPSELGSDISSTSFVSLRSLSRTPTPSADLVEVDEVIGVENGETLDLEIAVAIDEGKDGEAIPALSASPSAFMADSLLDISLVMNDHQRLLAETAHLVTKASRQGSREKRPVNFGTEVSRIVREHCAILSLAKRLFKVQDPRHDLPSLLECVAILQRQMQRLPLLGIHRKGDNSDNSSRDSLMSGSQGFEWESASTNSASDLASNSTASLKSSEQALRASLSIFSTIEEVARHLQDYDYLIQELRKGSKSSNRVISEAAFSNVETLASEIIEHENALMLVKCQLGLGDVVSELPGVAASFCDLLERSHPLILSQPNVALANSSTDLCDESQAVDRCLVRASVPEDVVDKCDAIVLTLTEFSSLVTWMRRTILQIPEDIPTSGTEDTDASLTLEPIDITSLYELKQHVRDFMTQLCDLQMSNQVLEQELAELSQAQQKMLQELRSESEMLSRLDSNPATPPSPNRRRADVLEGLLARQEAFRRQSSFQNREDLREVAFLRGNGLLTDAEEEPSSEEKSKPVLSSTTRLAIYKRLLDEKHFLERQLQTTKQEHANAVARYESSTQDLLRQSEVDKQYAREQAMQQLANMKKECLNVEARLNAEKKSLETRIKELAQNIKAQEAQAANDKQILEQQFNVNASELKSKFSMESHDAESRFEAEKAAIKHCFEQQNEILENEKKEIEQQLLDQSTRFEHQLVSWRQQVQSALDDELVLLRGCDELSSFVDEYQRVTGDSSASDSGYSRMNLWESVIAYIDRLNERLAEINHCNAEELEFLKTNGLLLDIPEDNTHKLHPFRMTMYKEQLASRERENTLRQELLDEIAFVKREVKLGFDENHPNKSRLRVYQALLDGQNALIEDKMERELEVARETAFLEAHSLSFESRMAALEYLVRVCEKLEIAKKQIVEEQALLVEQRVCTPQELRPSIRSREGKRVDTEAIADKLGDEHSLEEFASVRLDVYRKLLASEQQARDEMASREAAWKKELLEIQCQHSEEEASWKSDVRELESQQQEREIAWENEVQTLKHGHFERGIEWERELNTLKQLHLERETALATRLESLESELLSRLANRESELTNLKAQLEELQTTWNRKIESCETVNMGNEEQWTRAAFDDHWVQEQAMEKARTQEMFDEQKRKELSDAMEMWVKQSEDAIAAATSIAEVNAKAESEASFKDEIERMRKECNERVESLTAAHMSHLTRVAAVREVVDEHIKREISEAVTRSVASMRATLLERLAKRDGTAVAAIYRCIRMATDVLSPNTAGGYATADVTTAPPSRHGTSNGLGSGSASDKIPVGVTQAVVTLVKELKALKEHIAASLDQLQIAETESTNTFESTSASLLGITSVFVLGKGESHGYSSPDPDSLTRQDYITDTTLCAYRELKQYTEQQLLARQQIANESLTRLYKLMLGVEASAGSGAFSPQDFLESTPLRERAALEIELARERSAREDYECKQRLHETYVRRLLEDQRVMEVALSKTLEASQVECKQLQARIEQLEHYQRLALASSAGGVAFQSSPNAARPLMAPPSRGVSTSNASNMMQVPMRPERPRDYPSSIVKGGGTSHKEKFVSDLEKDTGQRRTGPGVAPNSSMGFSNGNGGGSPSAARRRRQYPGGIGDLDAASLSTSPSSSSLPARGSLVDQELWFQGVRTLHFVAFFVSVFYVPKQGVFRVEVLNSDTEQQQTVYVPLAEMQQFLVQHERNKRRRLGYNSASEIDEEREFSIVLEDPARHNEVVEALFDHVKVYGEGTSNMLLAFE